MKGRFSNLRHPVFPKSRSVPVPELRTHDVDYRVMPGPVLYSTNPWFATDIATKYFGGRHFVWCCEYFDVSKSPALSATALIAPSSTPKVIYDQLRADVEQEEHHSARLKGYRKTFSRLAKIWHSTGSITDIQRDDILGTLKRPSWKIWRPLLFVIPREPIEAAKRLLSVAPKDRASHGPELQILDLMPHEFDIIEF